jgi:hypothetical protein
MNGTSNAVIGSAAANVSREGVINVSVAWIMIPSEQDARSHDLAGLTIPALGHLLGDPGLLNWMTAIRREALNRRDLLAGGTRQQNLAGSDCVAVENHRAGAALPDATAVLGAGEIEMIAQNPEQGCPRICIYRSLPSIHRQCRFHRCPIKSDT